MEIPLHDSSYLSFWWYRFTLVVGFQIVSFVICIFSDFVRDSCHFIQMGHDDISWSVFLITWWLKLLYQFWSHRTRLWLQTLSFFCLFAYFSLNKFSPFFLLDGMMNLEMESSHVRLQRYLEYRWEAISFFWASYFFFTSIPLEFVLWISYALWGPCWCVSTWVILSGFCVRIRLRTEKKKIFIFCARWWCFHQLEIGRSQNIFWGTDSCSYLKFI